MSTSIECPICLSYIQDLVSTHCGHHYCKQCLTQSISGVSGNRCPICRVTMISCDNDNCLVCSIITSNLNIEDSLSATRGTNIPRQNGNEDLPKTCCCFLLSVFGLIYLFMNMRQLIMSEYDENHFPTPSPSHIS
tara:strand:+ start:936 stop:1340 length:405 start_codon:yes stop_codon:yes gene_type:complete